MIPNCNGRFHVTELDREALSGIAVGDLSDDGFDYTGCVVRKPWGFEYQIAATKEKAVWALHLSPGSETSMHCHPGKATELVVVVGTVIVWGLVGHMLLSAGQRVSIPAGKFHRTSTADGAVVIEVESPPNKRDLVRLSDKYGRQGRGYEVPNAPR